MAIDFIIVIVISLYFTAIIALIFLLLN